MQTIELILGNTGWACRFVDDPEILELFGTDVIPTPYTRNAAPLMVKEAIQARNPHAYVTFA